MRIRITYIKDLPLRFTSALDIQGIWERAIRRSRLYLAYSQGFHPKAKIQLGLPLPLGFIGENEMVDIWLQQDHAPEKLKDTIQPKMPKGLQIKSIQMIAESEKPVVTTISTSDYKVKFWDIGYALNGLQNRIDQLLNQDQIIRMKRNNKEYDLRPLIQDLRILEENEMNNGYAIFISLTSSQSKMGRADEVMFSLGFQLEDFLINRIRSY